MRRFSLFIAAFVCSLICFTTFTSCSDDDAPVSEPTIKELLVGTWTGQPYTYVFNADGTGKRDNTSMEWYYNEELHILSIRFPGSSDWYAVSWLLLEVNEKCWIGRKLSGNIQQYYETEFYERKVNN